MNKLSQIGPGCDYTAQIIQAYKKNSKPLEKKAEEIKIEMEKIKSLPEGTGTNINLLV